MIPEELTLWRRTDESIWTDEHISKRLLEAHLDPATDAASRNPAAIARTAEWLQEGLDAGARVLDLGCGPGLYASLLAEKGFRVTGIDISSRSIDYAREKALENRLPIEYIHGSYLERELGGPFDLILCIYCDFGALLPAEQSLLLGNVSRALAPGGVFAFDVFGPGLCGSKTEKRDWHSVSGGGFWSAGPHIVLEEVKHFPDSRAWGMRYVVAGENGVVKEYVIWDQYYSGSDIGALLAGHGFAVREIRTGLVEVNGFASGDVLFIKAMQKSA